ncbi:large subunit ribosomal protein L38e [Angomonas deanei]|nr:large subunit ribosomal protein L38e [Angomonas deanei]|eukprot:EPY37936.1 large subunit ribosomal protein L38e [Angomonas deanei]
MKRKEIYINMYLLAAGTGVGRGVATGRNGDLLHGGVNTLLNLIRLPLVVDDEGVEVAAAAHLELGVLGVLLDLHAAGILAGADGRETPSGS